MAKESMRSATLPEKEFEKSFDKLETSDLKYCSEFGAEKELTQANDKLAKYVRDHRAKR